MGQVVCGELLKGLPLSPSGRVPHDILVKHIRKNKSFARYEKAVRAVSELKTAKDGEVRINYTLKSLNSDEKPLGWDESARGRAGESMGFRV
eukprot:1021196-Amorphochlora_amoeboformis.AAC.3